MLKLRAEQERADRRRTLYRDVALFGLVGSLTYGAVFKHDEARPVYEDRPHSTFVRREHHDERGHSESLLQELSEEINDRQEELAKLQLMYSALAKESQTPATQQSALSTRAGASASEFGSTK